ncbi:MAG: hypothetical protein AAGB34_09015 [Planctomycetota bacterium]
MTSFDDQSNRSPASQPTEPRSDDELLLLIRNGDRDAAAEFILRHRLYLIRRIRGMLSQSARSLSETEDVFSSVARRLDRAVMNESINAENVDQLLAYLFRTSDNTCHTLWRKGRRGTRASAKVHQSEFEGIETEDQSELIETIEKHSKAGDYIDESMLQLRARGYTFTRIANALSLSPDLIRQRWHRMRKRIRDSRSELPSDDD